jgi:hypothetical protein
VRRFIPLIVLPIVIVACGGDVAVTTTTSTTITTVASATSSTTTSSTTTTSEAPPETTTTTIDFSQFTSTTEYRPVEPEYVLLLDGFGFFGVLGDDAETVIAAFGAEFGEPTADSGWVGVTDHGCLFEGDMRTVTWIEPGVRLTFVDGESEHGSGPHLAHYSTVLPVDPPWELDGIRREMTLEQVLDSFPAAELLPTTPLQQIQFDPEVTSYATIDAAGEIREFFAGTEYCVEQ